MGRLVGTLAIVGLLGGGGASAADSATRLGDSIVAGDVVTAPLASGVPDLTGTWNGRLRGRSQSLVTTDKPARLKLAVRLTVSQMGGAANSVLNFNPEGDGGLPTSDVTRLLQIGLDGESGSRTLTGFIDVFGTQTLCTGRASRSQRKMIASCVTISNDLANHYKLKLRRE